ncbi:CD320 antigen isoform X1 [Sarcophilus harrisii]|uniref:CD320 molecule n=1 Tax=Sarcophilus harrisii TaxID=9305 RepID=A0A7N4P1F7_SARHA|nr:CD320 antigen isoform X1 [Sarcophilus harrisii]
MARALLRLLPLLLAGLQRALILSLPSTPAQPRGLSRREGTEEPCPPSKFPCGHGICIPSEWLCDGDKDCLDGRDETSCRVEACAQGEERCPSETCSPLRCEGPQCVDLWIEPSCPPPPCLAEYRFCDGINDCPNGTDERLVDCRKRRSKMPSLGCAKQGFQCAPGVCIPHAWVCDGHPDCASGIDEHHCGTTGTPFNQAATLAESVTPGAVPSGNQSTTGLTMATGTTETATLSVSPIPGDGSAVPSGTLSINGITVTTGVTQAPEDQNTTPGRGSLTPSERRSAYGLVMAAAALSGILAAACLLVCCQTWAQVRWRLLPQPHLVEVVKDSLLMPERTPSSSI